MLLPTTLHFLSALRANNNREWFEAHRPEFAQAQQNFREFVGVLIPGVQALDSAIGPLEPADCLFRIHRDVRFRADKTPYKTNLGAYIAPGGRRSPWAGYYFHLEPGGSFVSGGIYMADPATMRIIRHDMVSYAQEFLALVQHPSFGQHFGSLGDERLRRVPQGFDPHSPLAEYLKLKHITPTMPLTDGEAVAPDIVARTLSAFHALAPLVKFLNEAIRSGAGSPP